MKHFLGYRSNGTIASVETYSPGGWPDCNCCEDCECLASPGCMMEACVSLRAKRADRNPDIVGYIAYDCPCPKTESICNLGCYNTFSAVNYVDVSTKTAKPKPTSVMQLDDIDVVADSTVSRPPGTAAEFKLVGPDIPDGSVVDVLTKGPADITEGPNQLQLTFTGGVTDSVTFYSPGQGVKVMVSVSGKFIRPRTFQFRGFGS